MPNVELVDTFYDDSLEMVGDQFRVKAALQALSHPAASEWWCPPAVAHDDSDEFTGSALHARWRWAAYNVGSWATIVPTGTVDLMTSPAAGTFRAAYNERLSHLSVQPARNYAVAVVRSFPRPAQCQFRARMVMPIPLAASIGDLEMGFALTSNLNLTYPDTVQHYVQASFGFTALNTVSWNVHSRDAAALGSSSISGNNLDLTPFDAEFIIHCDATTFRVFMIAGSTKHLLMERTIATMGPAGTTNYLYWYCKTSNNSGALMPAAPIYHLDYLRQRDDLVIL